MRVLAVIGGLVVALFAAFVALIALSGRDLFDDTDEYLITGI